MEYSWGVVKLGESLKEAVKREVLEETDLQVEPIEFVEVFERVIRDKENQIEYHYVLIDFVCRYISGEAKSGTDALDARWVVPKEISKYNMTSGTEEVIKKAFKKFSSFN